MGGLIGQGYVCFKTDNIQSMCIKGGSIYICPDSVTCIETAQKRGTLPRNSGVTKKSLR